VAEDERRVRIKVVKILERGVCPYGLKVGDEFVMGGEFPAGFCSWALATILPFIATVRFGGDLPWEEEKGVAHVCCPDPDNPVVFEITRLAD